MNNQVCSLELAKKLKELGVKQDSLFYWKWFYNSVGGGFDDPAKLTQDSVISSVGDEGWYKVVSAFTVVELGEMLPGRIGGKGLMCHKFQKGDWHIYYEVMLNSYDKPFIVDQLGDTEAEARAKMLIYLLESKLI